MSRSTRHAGAREGELWRGFRRPIRRDRVFWLAVILSVVAIGLEIGIAAAADALNWGALALFGVLLFIAVFTVVGVVAGTIRGFGEGWRGGRRRRSAQPTPTGTASAGSARPDPAGPDPTTTRAPPSGDPAAPTRPAMPKSISELSDTARTMASSVRKPTTDDVNRTARTIGRAIGAAKKAAREED